MLSLNIKSGCEIVPRFMRKRVQTCAAAKLLLRETLLIYGISALTIE